MTVRAIEKAFDRRYLPGVLSSLFTHTGTVAETTILTRKIRASELEINNVIRSVFCLGVAGITATQTLQIRLKFGAATPIAFDSGVITDPADDTWLIENELHVRSTTSLVSITRWTRFTAATGVIAATLEFRTTINTGVNLEIDNDLVLTSDLSLAGDNMTREFASVEVISGKVPVPVSA